MPPAAAAATPGARWNIGDGDGMLVPIPSWSHVRTAQHSESHPLQNDKELGKTRTAEGVLQMSTFFYNLT